MATSHSSRAAYVFPIFLAAFPALNLYSINLAHLVPSVMFGPLAASLAICLCLWGLSAWAWRDVRRGAVFCGSVLLLSIGLGELFLLADVTLVGKYLIDEYHYWIAVVAAYVIVRLMMRIGRTPHVQAAALILNAITIGLLTMPVVRVGRHIGTVMVRNVASSVRPLAASTSGPLRDIYYIILDGYAREDVLRAVYGYDNKPFIAFLRKNGFYVANQARCNYSFTILSLSSSLNMEYLNGLSLSPAQEETCTALLLHNNAMKFLKAKGYRIIQLSSGWVTTGAPMPQADIHYSPRSLNQFTTQLINTSLLRLVVPEHLEVNSQIEYIHYNLNILREIPLLPGPKFTFAHFVCPHPPFVFTRTGAPASRPHGILRLESDWMPKERYVDQLHYLNHAIEETIKVILARSKTDPIILLQSDHGPALPGLTNVPDPDIVFTRTSILDTFHLPGIDQKKWLSQTMTPVNSLRVVFDAYFGAGYDLLPDRTYFSGPIGAIPYEFHDVTQMKKAAN